MRGGEKTRSQAAGAILQALPFQLFLAVVVLAPLPLGSNREWSWSLCALLIGATGVLWSLTRLVPAGAARVNHHQVRAYTVIAFLAVIAWALFQAGPWAPAGWAHPLWQLAAEVLRGDAGETAGRISLAPDDTYTATMRLLCYGLVFYLAFQWGRDAHRARRTLQWLVAGGIAYAVYGLYNFWSGSETFFWFENPGYKNDMRGTFLAHSG